MCGIYGFIGKPTKRTAKVLLELAKLNEDRGKDSSGIVMANGQEIQFYKKAVNSTKFLEKETTLDILKNTKNCQFVNFIGHCRQATNGAINDNNAHPFRIGKFYLAHNGVINNFTELQAKYKTTYEVDSQIIGFLLNRFKDKFVFEQKLSGWFAVPYFDIENQNILHIAKSTSPLGLFYLPQNKGLFYSSEAEHLTKAIRKAGYKGKAVKVLGDKFYTFKWQGGSLQHTKDKLNIEHPTYNYNYAWGDYDYYGRPSTKTAKESTTQGMLNYGHYNGYWDDKDTEAEANKLITAENQREALAESKDYLKKYVGKDWYKRWFGESYETF